MQTMSDTALRQIRESLKATREDVTRRTRTLGLSTIRNAEKGKRITYGSAQEILEAINSLLREHGREPVSLDDLGLTLY